MCMPPACSRVVWLDKRLKDSRLEVEMKRWHALARDGSPLPTMNQVTSSPLAAVPPLAEIPACFLAENGRCHSERHRLGSKLVW